MTLPFGLPRRTSLTAKLAAVGLALLVALVYEVPGMPWRSMLVGAVAVWLLGYVALGNPRRAVIGAAVGGLLIEVLVPVQLVSNYGRLKYIPIYGLLLAAIGLARWRHRPQAKPTLLFAATMLAYGAPTYLQGNSFEQRVWLAATFSTIAIVALVTTFDAAQRLAFIRWFVAAAIGEAIYGYVEFTRQMTPLWASLSTNPYAPPGTVVGVLNPVTNDGRARAQGTLAHPLPMGLLLGVALVAVVMLPIFKRAWIKWLVAAALAFDIVYACGDRSIAVIVLIALLFFATRGRRTSIGRVLAGIPLLAASISVAYLGGVFQSTAVEELSRGNDITHRTTSMGSIGYLVQHQSILDTVFGNGYASAARLFSTGQLYTADNVYAVDNQFVSTLAMSGVLGLMLLLWLIVAAWRRGEAGPKVMMLVAVGTFFSFDVYLWPSTLTIFACSLALCFRREATAAAPPSASPATRTPMRW